MIAVNCLGRSLENCYNKVVWGGRGGGMWGGEGWGGGKRRGRGT